MKSIWLFLGLGLGLGLELTPAARADGKVFVEQVVLAPVEIPSQQAFLQYENGVERLVIETAFLGQGTNFAWIVPVPSKPKVTPVEPDFFARVRPPFEPSLRHQVPNLYFPLVIYMGLVLLGWRALRDETRWTSDLPLCLGLALTLAVGTRSVMVGGLILGVAITIRVLVCSKESFALAMLGALLVMGWGLMGKQMWDMGYILTMAAGGGGDARNVESEDVFILARQRAGIFDTVTLTGKNPRAVTDWLETHGFKAPRAIEPAVQEYLDRGWVFVASRARLDGGANALTTLHPLCFTFATSTAVYPLKLTGVDNSHCRIDLFVFGDHQATAPGFRVVRCDRVAVNCNAQPDQRWKPWLRFAGDDLLNLVGRATVGTKLSGDLSPRQMSRDAEIGWHRFSSRGAVVYSPAGARGLALNIAVPLAALGWVLAGASHAGWNRDGKIIARWRRRLGIAACGIGLLVYWLLPKAEVILM